MKLKLFEEFINESFDIDKLSDFLTKYADDNIGNDPGGEPAYYLNVYEDTIGIGTFINEKYSNVIPDIDNPNVKKEIEDEWRDFGKHLINEIDEKFGIVYFIEYITVYKKKHGIILKKEY